MNNNIIKCICILVLTFLSACKKKVHETTLHLSPFQKNCVNFNNGTYWIYRNDSTSIEDSLYVTYQSSTYLTYENGEGIQNYEKYFSIVEARIDSSPMQIAAENMDVIYSLFGGNFSSKCNENTLIDDPTHRNILSISDIPINGDTIHNVYEIENNFYGWPQVNYYRITAFVSPEIGIIRWKAFYNDSTSKSYTLVRYNIYR
jgi:hypothetical protein